jgi:FMN phosphatase YigB (HAD superfamily)
MSREVVVLDVGDVLIRTVPMAHYQALARLTGMAPKEVTQVIESSDIVGAFETGAMTAAQFSRTVCRLLQTTIPMEAVGTAWNTVVAEVDEVIAVPARRLAAAGRLILASNTNPFHWRVVNARLSGTGLVAPALLSFELGSAKPNPLFFKTLGRWARVSEDRVIYIDDRADNVEVATGRGMTGCLHRNPARTAELLDAIAS